MKNNQSPYTLKALLLLGLFCSLSVFYSCKSNSSSTENKEQDNHEHEEENSNKTSLTPDQMKSIQIAFGEIEDKNLTATIKVNGKLKVPNNNKANITSMYGGVIQTLNIEVGSKVRKGQVIATISHPNIIQIQEEYLTILSKINFAELEQQRQKDLNDGNVGALKNLQNADTELKNLKIRKASLYQQIQLMGINPDRIDNTNVKRNISILSPIDGSVSNIYAKIGSYVDVSSPVAEVVNNSGIHLDVNVYEKDLPFLKIGQTVNFTLTNNPSVSYQAKIFSISSAFENESKTIPIHCDVIGEKNGLIDGMNVTALIDLNNAPTKAVKNGAIVEADGKNYIFIVTEDKDKHNDAKETAFEKIEVAKGVSELGYTAVTPVKEIEKGTQVVVNGAFFINAKMSDTGEHEH